MQNLSSSTFWRHTYHLNLAGCRRRGLTSRFAWPARPLGTLAAAQLAIIIASRASADEVTRWNQIATAAAILKARKNEGASRTVQYIPGIKPGEYLTKRRSKAMICPF